MIEHRYRILRFVAGFFQLGGVFVLMLGLLGAFAAAVAAVVLGTNLLESICWYPECALLGEPAGSLLLVLCGFLLALALFFALFGAGDLLALLISMEDNTRRTALALRAALAAPPATAAAVPPVVQAAPEASVTTVTPVPPPLPAEVQVEPGEPPNP